MAVGCGVKAGGGVGVGAVVGVGAGEGTVAVAVGVAGECVPVGSDGVDITEGVTSGISVAARCAGSGSESQAMRKATAIEDRRMKIDLSFPFGLMPYTVYSKIR